MSNITFKDVYKPPFRVDEFCPINVRSSNNVMTFTYFRYNQDDLKEMVAILNGESEKRITDNVRYENTVIYIDDCPVLRVRGWGHLTGCGAMNLPVEVAVKIQDDFGEWVVNKLTKREEYE